MGEGEEHLPGFRLSCHAQLEWGAERKQDCVATTAQKRTRVQEHEREWWWERGWRHEEEGGGTKERVMASEGEMGYERARQERCDAGRGAVVAMWATPMTGGAGLWRWKQKVRATKGHPDTGSTYLLSCYSPPCSHRKQGPMYSLKQGWRKGEDTLYVLSPSPPGPDW